MIGVQDLGYEVIFDPIAKSAILRRGGDLTFLNGPFKTSKEANDAALAHLEQTIGPLLQTRPH
jgi:hypothetical protein